jgi:NAD(P)H dehydrogenase (quinone)
MKVLIVHAHHEPTSFNGALTRHASEALVAAGHEAAVSDLYAMGFDPVSDRRNFTTVADPARLRQQDEEALASARGGFAPELQAEMDKVAWCDALILQFPIWWLGPPAILKGWIDRVFAVGVAYGGGRCFDEGRFAGKRAMCSVTVGGPEEAYSETSAYASIEDILFPLHRGVLAFTGFAVIEPFVVHAPNRIDQEQRVEQLARYRERVLSLNAAPLVAGPKVADLPWLASRAATRKQRL